MTLDELDRLHAESERNSPSPWTVDHARRVRDADRCLTHGVDSLSIVALHNAWPEVSARLRAAEADVERLRQHYDAAAPEHNLLAVLDMYEGRRLEAVAEVERLRGEVAEHRALLRWFLDGDDHTHEDDCGARGQHDHDVCRGVMCVDLGCEGPHCTCDATEMRDRALAALGEP